MPKRKLEKSDSETSRHMDLQSSTAEDCWFSANQYAGDVSEFVETFDGERELHLVDLFSASGQASGCWTAAGYNAEACDITRDGNWDMSSRGGFFNTLSLCLRVLPFGLALAGPPCSWFIFLSSSMHRRTAASPEGDLSEARVRLSNLITANCVALLQIAAARGVFVMVEQPANSLMFHFELFAAWVRSDPRLRFVMTYMVASGTSCSSRRSS